MRIGLLNNIVGLSTFFRFSSRAHHSLLGPAPTSHNPTLYPKPQPYIFVTKYGDVCYKFHISSKLSGT